MIGTLDLNYDHGIGYFSLLVMSFYGVVIIFNSTVGMKFKLVALMLRCIILGAHPHFAHRLEYSIAETCFFLAQIKD